MVNGVVVGAVVVLVVAWAVACTRPMPPAPVDPTAVGPAETIDPNVTTVPACSPCLYDTKCRRVIASDNDRPTLCCEPILRMVLWFRGSTGDPLVAGECITADEEAAVRTCAANEAAHGVRLLPGRMPNGGYESGDTFQASPSPENPCVAIDPTPPPRSSRPRFDWNDDAGGD